MTGVTRRLIIGCVIVTAALSGLVVGADEVNLKLTLRDSETGELVPGRITVEEHPAGAPFVYHFVESLDPAGTAIPYDVTRGPGSFEKHTTVSAHPFGATVPPGFYVVYYEHGPEWRGNKAQLTVKEGEVTEYELSTSRWIDMSERGWYSGDTHVHRTVEDLPNVMRAEDLNVALPLSYWVRDAYTPPAQGDKTVAVEPGLITVDPNRVIWPMNTEYELFTLNGQRHTQGAFFVLNHQQPLTLPAPPVAPIAAEARRQGVILDLDKHSWPWSMMLVPIMDVDLFELANNHIWRTEFFFKQWTQEMRPDGWNIETDADGFTEWGWIDFGFKSYYALLNCGFKMRPTAGTANGVHPVPLGYGRVYVECPKGFSYDNWMTNLNAGRSFVTTGQMLFVTVNDKPPGSKIEVDEPTTVRVQGTIEAITGNQRVEIVKNGLVVKVLDGLEWEYESPWIWRAKIDEEIPIDGSSWVAVRCFANKQIGRRHKLQFAHSSPVHIEMPGRPLQPRKIETDYFVRRMEEEIERNRDKLRPDELAEYEKARDIYGALGETAIDERPTTNEELLSLIIPADELPDGWTSMDISEMNIEAAEPIPTLVSRPDMAGVFSWIAGARSPKASNVVREVIALYRNTNGKPGMIMVASVAADEESAQANAEILKNRDDARGPLHTWHRGDLMVVLLAGEKMSDDEFQVWVQRIDARLP
ncbi:MAG: CehA/McbA family metallohydrolase [Planctomycetaceae bacterium]|nr:CehA/McbA family metallohydrolase [Planctomycetaceae bacterium]